jgi:hypothetical protein
MAFSFYRGPAHERRPIMWFNEICKRWLGRSAKRRTPRPVAARYRGLRLRLEQLEERTVPSNFTAASVADLIADVSAANLAGGSNTITLVAGTTYTLTAVDNKTDGPTGLPVIAANDNLTIIGNGDVIERSTATGTLAFRLFDVAAGAVLNLTHLTLQGGAATPFGLQAPQDIARGGAVYKVGTLNLDSVTVQGNTAQGWAGAYLWGGSILPAASAKGGGIYSGGLLAVTDCTIQNNRATGTTERPAAVARTASLSTEGPPAIRAQDRVRRAGSPSAVGCTSRAAPWQSAIPRSPETPPKAATEATDTDIRVAAGVETAAAASAAGSMWPAAP